MRVGGGDALLKRRLDDLYRATTAVHAGGDPLCFPRQYEVDADREVVAFIAAQFAYGNVKQIFRSVQFILDRLTLHPANFLRSYRADHLQRFTGFRHRLHGPADLRLLLLSTGEVLRRWGSIEGLFAEGYRGDVQMAVSAFSRRLLEISKGLQSRPGKFFGFFIPDPVARGSACKRLNMFLRWVVRRDSIDLGIWTCVRPADLVIPLDTHVARIARHLGLTRRRSNDWRTAEEITARLRLLDPHDPVKYDFSLARLGILRRCPHRRDPRRCADCPLSDVCRGTPGHGASRGY